MICTSCHHQGEAINSSKGSFLIEIILWLFFIVPGLIYTLWRLTTKNKVCPMCGNSSLIPENSPKGRELLNIERSKPFKEKQNNYSNFDDQNFSKTNKKTLFKKWWFWLIIVFFMYSSYIGKQTAVQDRALNSSGKIDKSQEIQTSVFDIPSLLYRNIDEIDEILGGLEGSEPTELQLQYGLLETDKYFSKDGQMLYIAYNASTREVIDFFIPTDDPTGSTNNKERLLKIGNLSNNNDNYIIEFVKNVENPSRFTGVIVTPKR